MAPFLTALFKTQAPPAAPDHHTAAVGSSCSSEVQKEALLLPPTSPPPLSSVFKLMDQNGDGLLSVEDMSGCFHKLGVELPPRLLSDLLSSFPLSHPGFLLFHEFEVLYSRVCKDLLSLYDQQYHPIPDPHGSNPPHDDDDDAHSSISSNLDGNGGAASCNGGNRVSVQSCGNDYVHHGHTHSPGSGGPCVMEAYDVFTENSNSNEEPPTDGGSSDPKGDVPDGADSDDDELLGAFRVFDKNADGFISLPELQTVMCSLGFAQCKDDSFCRGIMQRVDSNGDGVVDFSEFKQMMLSSMCG